MMINKITIDHLNQYGEIYAAAFSGEPWNDPWKPEDAVIHVKVYCRRFMRTMDLRKKTM